MNLGVFQPVDNLDNSSLPVENTVPNLISNNNEVAIIVHEKIELNKPDLVSEIYDMLDPAIKIDIDNKYTNYTLDESNNIIPVDTLFESEIDNKYGLNRQIGLDISKYNNDYYKLYKYFKNDNTYYITFNKITKKYAKILSNDENINDYEIIDNSALVFESERWNELFENVVNL